MGLSVYDIITPSFSLSKSIKIQRSRMRCTNLWLFCCISQAKRLYQVYNTDWGLLHWCIKDNLHAYNNQLRMVWLGQMWHKQVSKYRKKADAPKTKKLLSPLKKRIEIPDRNLTFRALALNMLKIWLRTVPFLNLHINSATASYPDFPRPGGGKVPTFH